MSSNEGTSKDTDCCVLAQHRLRHLCFRGHGDVETGPGGEQGAGPQATSAAAGMLEESASNNSFADFHLYCGSAHREIR